MLPGFRDCGLPGQRFEISFSVNLYNLTRRYTDILSRNTFTLDSDVDAVQIQGRLINPGIRNSLLQSLFWTNDLAEAKAPESFRNVPPAYRQERDYPVRIVIITDNEFLVQDNDITIVRPAFENFQRLVKRIYCRFFIP